ncbi:MAG: cytochrome b/b6 domain-containing protein [Coriobacteriia bacterium]
MQQRATIAVAIGLALVVGAAYAWGIAFSGADLLFDSASWLIWFAPLAGVLAAGLTRRKDPAIEGDRVLRHDGAAMLAHWTHGLGTAALLVSGVMLGLFFTPALVLGKEPIWAWMNIHFVFTIVFLFGTFYWAANTLLSPRRLREHLPTANALEYTKRHYGLLLGMKKFSMPPEAKYFESEKMAFLLAVVATSAVIITGFVKAAAHIVNVPAPVMGVITPAHDIAAVGMLAFFLAHVLFAAVLPMGWPMLRSMFTGYVSLEHAKAEHSGWLEELEDAPASKRDQGRVA